MHPVLQVVRTRILTSLCSSERLGGGRGDGGMGGGGERGGGEVLELFPVLLQGLVPRCVVLLHCIMLLQGLVPRCIVLLHCIMLLQGLVPRCVVLLHCIMLLQCLVPRCVVLLHCIMLLQGLVPRCVVLLHCIMLLQDLVPCYAGAPPDVGLDVGVGAICSEQEHHCVCLALHYHQLFTGKSSGHR